MTAVPPGGGEVTQDDKTWSMLAWLGMIVIGFIAPLIVMLTKGNESKWTRDNAVEALNFSIIIVIGYVISFILSVVFIGMLLIPVLLIVNVIFSIIGGMACNKGESYKCPVNFFRLVK